MTTTALHVDGNQIKNVANEIVKLRGGNYTYFMNTEKGSWQTIAGGINWDTWDIDAIGDFLDALKLRGYNIIRTLMTIEFWIDDSESYQDKIKYFINQCAAHDIYVMLAPWRVSRLASDGIPVVIPYPPVDSDANDTAVIANAAALVSWWGDVAGALTAYNNVIIDLWNEPNAGALEAQEDDWFVTVQNCIDEIRLHSSTAIIDVCFGHQGAGLTYDFGTTFTDDFSWVAHNPLTDSENNLIYDMHAYHTNCYNSTAGYTYPWSDADVLTWLTESLADSLGNPIYNTYPIMIGEIGYSNWTGSAAEECEWYTNTLQRFNEYGLHYCAWALPPWRGSDNWGIFSGNANFTLHKDYGDCPGVTFTDSVLGQLGRKATLQFK